MAGGVAASRLRAAIVASGSELVRGDRQDRNGPFLAASLLRLGSFLARAGVYLAVTGALALAFYGILRWAQ